MTIRNPRKLITYQPFSKLSHSLVTISSTNNERSLDGSAAVGYVTGHQVHELWEKTTEQLGTRFTGCERRPLYNSAPDSHVIQPGSGSLMIGGGLYITLSLRVLFCKLKSAKLTRVLQSLIISAFHNIIHLVLCIKKIITASLEDG